MSVDHEANRPIRTGTIPDRASDFVDTGVLDRLAKCLSDTGRATLTGPGGIGKTQVAAEFARRCIRDGWPVVAWVNGETESSLKTDLAVLANEAVGYREGEEHSALMRRWLAEWNRVPDRRRLIVFDDLTSPAAMRDVLPNLGAVTAIATTRSEDVALSSDVVDVAAWTPRVVADYLASRTGLTDDEGAVRVGSELGFLPLALAQASWFISQRRRLWPAYGYADYQRELDKALTAGQDDGYARTITQVIAMAVERMLAVCENTDVAKMVFGVLAHLDPDGVPISWLNVPGEVRIDLDKVLDAIEASSLATTSHDGTSLLVHRLVGRVLRNTEGLTWDNMDSNVAQVLAAPQRLDAAEFWGQREQATLLARHIRAALDHLADSRPSADVIIGAAIRCGRRLNDVHLPRESIAFHEGLVAVCERVSGQHHPDTLSSRDHLAAAYQAVGDLARARLMYEQTLADRERTLGVDHPDTLASRDHLAGAYRDMGHRARRRQR